MTDSEKGLIWTRLWHVRSLPRPSYVKGDNRLEALPGVGNIKVSFPKLATSVGLTGMKTLAH